MRKTEDKFKVGDKVFSKTNGKGVVKSINSNDYDFHYFIIFEDGTLAWRAEDKLQLQK